jgi:hypothetical protein
MSLAEIEAELDKLDTDEIRRLALISWTALLRKEGRADGANECDESDPRRLTALDEAIARADATPGQGHTGSQVQARLNDVFARLDQRFSNYQII